MFGGPFFDIECFLFIVHVVKNVSFGEPLRVVEVFRARFQALSSELRSPWSIWN